MIMRTFKLTILSTLLLSSTPAFAGLSDGVKAFDQGDYDTAFQELKPAAEQGDATAQHMLAGMYKGGFGTEKNNQEAIKWYKKAADQGLSAAMYSLSIDYLNGDGVEQNWDTSLSWMEKAAAQGYFIARENLLALNKLDEKNNQKPQMTLRDIPSPLPFQELRGRARSGHANSAYQLSQMNFSGIGVKKNTINAIEWLKMAAAYGHGKAAFELGQMYLNGKNIDQNDDQAEIWLRIAALQKLPIAQYELSLFYASQGDDLYNQSRALKWMKLANNGGYKKARAVIKKMGIGREPTPIQLRVEALGQKTELSAQDIDELKNLTKQGNANAALMVAQTFENDPDLSSANNQKKFKWMKLAYDLGNHNAAFGLATSYHIGLGVKKNQTKAARYFRESAILGNSTSQYYLSLLYLNGSGIATSTSIAMYWMHRSDDQGDDQARAFAKKVPGWETTTLVNGGGYSGIDGVNYFEETLVSAIDGNLTSQMTIGRMYASGRDAIKNQKQAFRWINKAAQRNDFKAQFLIGEMYRDGQGVKQNLDAAACWLKVSSDQRNAVAMRKLNQLIYQGNNENFKFPPIGSNDEDVQKTAPFRKAALRGNAKAAYLIGNYYNNNNDEVLAFRWYLQSAMRGYTPAQMTVAIRYINGTYTKENKEAGLCWLKESARKGNAQARENLFNYTDPDFSYARIPAFKTKK